MKTHWVYHRPGYRCRHGHTSATRSKPGRTPNTHLREDHVLPHLPALLLRLTHRLTGPGPDAPAALSTSTGPPTPTEAIAHLRIEAISLTYDPALRPGNQNPDRQHPPSREDQYRLTRVPPTLTDEGRSRRRTPKRLTPAPARSRKRVPIPPAREPSTVGELCVRSRSPALTIRSRSRRDGSRCRSHRAAPASLHETRPPLAGAPEILASLHRHRAWAPQRAVMVAVVAAEAWTRPRVIGAARGRQPPRQETGARPMRTLPGGRTRRTRRYRATSAFT
ncbi:hypothetical protein [Streptomyces poonensis]|uniref:hypothetical protein n=1 Tax=Streptomyces poonensis TaxID=68255 RepID=UPI001E3FDBDF|nr:hypothetical protein [Streptomyces poonensis]